MKGSPLVEEVPSLMHCYTLTTSSPCASRRSYRPYKGPPKDAAGTGASIYGQRRINRSEFDCMILISMDQFSTSKKGDMVGTISAQPYGLIQQSVGPLQYGHCRVRL